MYSQPMQQRDINGKIEFFGNFTPEESLFPYQNDLSYYHEESYYPQNNCQMGDAEYQCQQDQCLYIQTQQQEVNNTISIEQMQFPQNLNEQIQKSEPCQKIKINTYNQNTRNCLRDYFQEFIQENNIENYQIYLNQHQITKKEYQMFLRKFFFNNNKRKITIKIIQQIVKIAEGQIYHKEAQCFLKIIQSNLLAIVFKMNKKKYTQQKFTDQMNWFFDFLATYIDLY
ncbi:hypothetical protein ABPG74_017918 [Tetrahymena malaccensis]